MKAIRDYFETHKGVTLFWMWVFFALTLGYMLLCLLVFPTWNFWLSAIPGLICLFLRLAYSKAAYDPRKDRFSPEYIPYRDRKG